MAVISIAQTTAADMNADLEPKTLAILHASQLVTVAGPRRPRVGAEPCDLAIITDGGMLVRDGAIVATGSSVEIEGQMPGDAEVVDAMDRVVLPGFIDAHSHLVFWRRPPG